jgi:acetyltransferase-like isoleucine patch superfamily enzyme
MHLVTQIRALLRSLASLVRREIYQERLRATSPKTHFEWPIHVTVDDFTAISIGEDCLIGPYSEIVVLKRSPCSPVSGQLTIEAGVRIGMGANIRAAGGVIHIGRNTQIGQHVSLIASNHLIDKTTKRMLPDQWDSAKTGVVIGDDCWIGAGVIILPGVIVDKGAIIGAGSIVTKSVGRGEFWHGQPARPASRSF